MINNNYKKTNILKIKSNLFHYFSEIELYAINVDLDKERKTASLKNILLAVK